MYIHDRKNKRKKGRHAVQSPLDSCSEITIEKTRNGSRFNHLVESLKLKPIWAGYNGNGDVFGFKIQFDRYQPTVTVNCVTFSMSKPSLTI